MIITVTLNPAIDKTVRIPDLIVGDLNRVQEVRFEIGGKGVNVSKFIKMLGGISVALGFIGGSNGELVEENLTLLGIKNDFVRVDGESRTNTKIIEENGRVTELNEKGPSVELGQIDKLIVKIEKYANEESIFVLSGSIPEGIENDIYKKIIKCVHDKGGRVILDADGEAFRIGLEAIPDMIKPNILEMSKINVDNLEVDKITDDIIGNGVKTIVLSMGKDGAYFKREKNNACYRKAVPVKVRNTVGAGDAMVAAMAYALEKNMKFEDMVDLCMTTSAHVISQERTF